MYFFKPLIAFFGLALAASLAMAAGKPFDAAEFAALQKAGTSVVLSVHADWCPTCKRQEPLVQKQMDDPKNASIRFMQVDFDKDKDVLRRLRVSSQSTLLAFKGGTEVKRSTGDTTEAGIAALVHSVR